MLGSPSRAYQYVCILGQDFVRMRLDNPLHRRPRIQLLYRHSRRLLARLFAVSLSLLFFLRFFLSFVYFPLMPRINISRDL